MVLDNNGYEMEKLLWKATFVRVWTRFIDNFFEKRSFSRVWARLFEQVFENRTCFCDWARFHDTIRKKLLRVGDVLVESFFETKTCSAYWHDNVFFVGNVFVNHFFHVWTRLFENLFGKQNSVLGVWQRFRRTVSWKIEIMEKWK
jgi:hypothetical protein